MSRIGHQDVLLFLALSNIHYPLFALMGVGFSVSLLPMQAAFVMAAALVTGRLSTIFSVVPYIVVCVLYFSSLWFMGIGYPSVSAYVTAMQTATAIAFLQYLLSVGQLGAREVVKNVQKLLGAYIVAFTLLVLYIRASGNVDLFNQVAQSNYLGLLTTYFILSVVRRRWISRGGGWVVGASLLVNIVGHHRASLLINLFVVAGRYVFARILVLTLVLIAVGVGYVLYFDRINSGLIPLLSSLDDYYAVALLKFGDVEAVIRKSVITAGETYDTSLLIRFFSMLYVASEVLANPMSPIAASEYGYLSNSHNLLLEYFKVGGLLFVVLSFFAVFRRLRALIRRGYCKVDPYGAVLAIGYTMLSNDLFVGFLLLPLSFEAGSIITKRLQSQT